MKRIAKPALILAVILAASLLSGCMRLEMNIKVTEDGLADVRILEAFSSTLEEVGQGALMSAETLSRLEESGCAVSTYKDEAAGYSGYRIEKQGIDLRALAKNGQSSLLGSGAGETLSGCRFTLDGDKARISFVPLSSDTYKSYSSLLPMVKTAGGYFKIVLELPTEPDSHNALSVSEDGKTLTWDVLAMEPGEEIFAEFTLPSRFSVSSLLSNQLLRGALIGAGAVLAVVLIVSAAKKKAKKA